MNAYGDYPSNENMSALWGVTEVLKVLGIDHLGIGKKYHCPVCGNHYGSNYEARGHNPECHKCGWEGKDGE